MGGKKMKFPNDEDGQVLKMLYKEGLDLNKPQNIDFFVAAPDEERAIQIGKVIEQAGFQVEPLYNEELKDWTCYVYVNLFLSYEIIIEIQVRLHTLAKPFDGYIDGWAAMVE